MKRTVYLDSTIPSYLYDQRKEIKTFVEITKKWWKEESNNFLTWISEETLNELYKGDYPNKAKIIKFIANLNVLEPDESIMDFLLTWNCSHLANANKKNHIRRINAMLNLPTPEIITPLELFQEEKNDRSINFR